jgi:hypothetical protein
MAMIAAERQLEKGLVTKLGDLKYEYRPDICDRATLEANFRAKFEALNRVRLITAMRRVDAEEWERRLCGMDESERCADREALLGA